MIDKIAKDLRASWDKQDDLARLLLVVALAQVIGWVSAVLIMLVAVAFSS